MYGQGYPPPGGYYPDPNAAYQGGYGAPPPQGYPPQPGYPPAPVGYGAPPVAQPGYGYGAPPPVAQPGYGAPPPAQGMGGGYGPQVPAQAGGVNENGVRFAPLSGRKKALLIGINYTGTNAALRGCINDVLRMKEFLKANGFTESPNTMVVLTDDQMDNKRKPTKRNMVAAMQWLVQGSSPGDSLFLHYSGHGGQVRDTSGDEDDGYDETIFPCDYTQAGQLVDDELHQILVKTLPTGVRLTVIFDSCHSGTALDLPVVYDAGGRMGGNATQPVINMGSGNPDISTLLGLATGFMGGNSNPAAMFSVGNMVQEGIHHYTKLKRGKHSRNIEDLERSGPGGGDVVMFSGCRDDQTSMDANLGGIATGAMSYSLMEALTKGQGTNMSYATLLKMTREIMQGRFKQVPQLSTGREMDMNQPFNI
eukprot:TRINITY_DN1789_c0_g1_i1.p1 TRINITY_DN1789_c0_g1~~TRINITY_DN1789_c0_g1_i1.p1  ORF type:complete len:421 (-),score=166.98 TRINITY_DN1789_c0_g1_i1:301-1563(-)